MRSISEVPVVICLIHQSLKSDGTHVVTTAGRPSGIAATASATAIWTGTRK